MFYTFNRFFDENRLDDALLYIQSTFKCDDEKAKRVLILYEAQTYRKVKKDYDDAISSLTPEQIAYNNAVARELLNKPKCPTCSSTNIQKISGTAKAIGAATFGIFSKTAKSQFKCNNCGYKW